MHQKRVSFGHPSLILGNRKTGRVCTANSIGDYGEIDSYAPSHDEPGMAEANAERLRIEQEHRSILEDVLQKVLTEQPTSFDAIYKNYSGKCTSRELKKKLDKSRVRTRVKSYLRDMENEGKLKRVRDVREYFYVVAETEEGDVACGERTASM